MTRIPDIDKTLRSLDAARHHGAAADTQRSQADLRHILATDPTSLPRGPRSSATAGRRRAQGSPARTGRRAAVILGAAAAVTAGLIALPSLNGGDPAFATWTPVPAGMTEQEQSTAAAECRASQKDTGGGMYAHDVETATLAIAERRGAWTTVVLAGTDGFSAMCITDGSSHPFDKGMIGSVGRPTGYAAPGPRDLAASDLGTGTMKAGDISLAAGAAGSDVAGVSYESRTHMEVAATVSEGRFALWLPGDELENSAAEGLEVEVTYRDGTTGTSRLSF